MVQTAERMASPSLESLAPHVDESQLDGVELFVLEGEFDAYAAPALEQQLLEAIERGRYELVVDMAGVSFVDMTTLNVIVRAIKRVYQHNGHLVLVYRQGAVPRAIELGGLRHALRVFPTREEAIASLQRPGAVPDEQHDEARDRRLPHLPRLRSRR
jgi:anti-sigma B factor antagonist